MDNRFSFRLQAASCSRRNLFFVLCSTHLFLVLHLKSQRRINKTDTVDLSYPWGRVSCAYGKQDDRLTMRIEVSNTSSAPLNEFSLRLMELNFPRVPNGGTLEAGMFGFGFKGPEWPLNRWPPSIPSVADPRFVVPIVRADFGTGALNFCSDDLECSVGIPHTTNLPGGTRYPLVITCRDIKPGVSKTFNVSLRFGPAGAQVQDSRATFWNGTRRSIPSR